MAEAISAGCLSGPRWFRPGSIAVRALGSMLARISTFSRNHGRVSPPWSSNTGGGDLGRLSGSEGPSAHGGQFVGEEERRFPLGLREAGLAEPIPDRVPVAVVSDAAQEHIECGGGVALTGGRQRGAHIGSRRYLPQWPGRLSRLEQDQSGNEVRILEYEL